MDYPTAAVRHSRESLHLAGGFDNLGHCQSRIPFRDMGGGPSTEVRKFDRLARTIDLEDEVGAVFGGLIDSWCSTPSRQEVHSFDKSRESGTGGTQRRAEYGRVGPHGDFL